MPDIPEFKKEELALAVNRIKGPSNFITNLCLQAREPSEANFIRIDSWVSGRDAVPFAQPDGMGTAVAGATKETVVVEPPTLKPKLPFSGMTILNGRMPGEVLMSQGPQTRTAAIQDAIGKDQAILVTQVENRMEWMAAKMLTPRSGSTDGTGFTYSPADQSVAFSVKYNVQVSHIVDVSASGPWGTTGNPVNDFRTADELISEDGSVGATHAILGREAASAFLSNANVRATLDVKVEGLDVALRQINPLGARLLGRLHGINVWEYVRKVRTPEDGTTTALINPKHAVFLSATPEAQMGFKFAGIPDMAAIFDGQMRAERFAKAWFVEETGQWIQMVISRPIPVLANPDAVAVFVTVP